MADEAAMATPPPGLLGDSTTFPVGSANFYIYAAISLAIVLVAGLMAGLTMGVVGIDASFLEIISVTGTSKQQKQARTLLPFVKRHHLTLVTLLLANSAANEALPIFLSKIVSEAVAIVLSVSFVLVFGEIIPSALFTGPNQLRITAALSPLLKALTVVLYIIAKPIAWILDKLMGEHGHGTRYKRQELKEFIRLHAEEDGAGSVADPAVATSRQLLKRGSSRTAHHRGKSKNLEADLAEVGGRGAQAVDASGAAGLFVVANQHTGQENLMQSHLLSQDEVMIMQGAMDLRTRPVIDSMIMLQDVFMVPLSARMDGTLMNALLESTHSRVPVYDGERHNVVGLIIVKFLIKLNPEDATPVADLPLVKPVVVNPHLSMMECLNVFQAGKSHLALICRKARRPTPEHLYEDLPSEGSVQADGIVTLEDVIEALIQEAITDESDLLGKRRRAGADAGAGAGSGAGGQPNPSSPRTNGAAAPRTRGGSGPQSSAVQPSTPLLSAYHALVE